jgi:prepilin-type processing-associated H-X9-DG protein
MNHLMYGPVITGSEDFSVFRCPGNEGMSDASLDLPPPPIQPPSNAPAGLYSVSVFRATGNSYQGDLWNFAEKESGSGSGSPASRKVVRWRFGAYKRPQNLFPDSAKSLLFWETRFMQALVSTVEIGSGGRANVNRQFGRFPTTIMGSHGKLGKFNVVFADGHATTVNCRREGNMFRPTDFQVSSRFWPYHWRSSEWQYDNFPAKHVTDKPQ